MKIWELLEAEMPKSLGRTFNHLEDLVFFHGSAGTIEALDHLKDFNTEQGSSSIRFKWDGCIHGDTVLKTTSGDMPISEFIEKFKTDKSIKVYGKDLKTNTDTVVDVLGTNVTHGPKKWVRLELENGSQLTLTEDHRVHTSNRGWIEAGKITCDDDITEMKCDLESLFTKECMKVSNIIKLEEKYIQYDITTSTENFYVKTGSAYLLIHNSPQIYWGRQNGVYIPPHGHNQWSKAVLPKTPQDVSDFIMSTGRAASPEEIENRQKFANQFAGLAEMFEKATPPTLEGTDTFFVYADALFLVQPKLKNGVYTFCPNPKSQTCYHVRQESELGQRISRSNVMVVGHAYFTEHGQPDSAQIPIKDFSSFNSNPAVIVLGPIYNVAPVKVDNSRIIQVEDYIKQHATQVDKFLAGVTGLSDIKSIIYTYVNQTAKARQLDSLSTQHFVEWLNSGKVSAPKTARILQLNEDSDNALEVIFTIVKAVQILKDDVIDQIESGPKAEIWDTHGEGRVRYAGPEKQFGHVKLVPRKRWTPQ